MHNKVLSFLRKNFKLNGDSRQREIRERISTHWPNDDLAAVDLLPAAVQAQDAVEDGIGMEALVSEAKRFLHAEAIVDGIPEQEINESDIDFLWDDWFGIAPMLLQYTLVDALNVIPDAIAPLIASALRDADNEQWKTKLILLAVKLIATPAFDDLAEALVLELTDRSDVHERHLLRVAAAIALGKMNRGGERAINAIVSVADDRSEPQPSRSYCIVDPIA